MTKNYDKASQGIAPANNNPARSARVLSPNNAKLIRGDQAALNRNNAPFAKSPPAQPATRPWQRG